jgi:ankyrin repeat protein
MAKDPFVELAFGNMSLFIQGLTDIDINATNSDGANFLQTALAFKKHEVAPTLIERGIDINHADEDGRTPLHYAATYHAHDVARLILDAGGDLSLADVHGNTPLWTAVHEIDHDMVRLFIAHGADPNHTNNSGRSPLDFAGTMNVQALVDLLRPEQDKGTRFDTRDLHNP